MGQRHHAREIALQVLYQIEMTGLSPEESLSLYYTYLGPSETPQAFTEVLVQGVQTNLFEIDLYIASASEHWRLDRMSIVDRNILRIAIYEMLFCEDVPPKVSINEAIDLGKRFGSEDSGPFINGVLDHIFWELTKQGKFASGSS
jgi:N utilization substance protein B